MKLVEVNLSALEEAVTLLVGPQVREMIRALYVALDAAESRGQIAANASALEYIDKERCEAAVGGRNRGYQEGYADGLEDGSTRLMFEVETPPKLNAHTEGADWSYMIKENENRTAQALREAGLHALTPLAHEDDYVSLAKNFLGEE